MTNRFWIVTVCGVLMGSANAGAQSSAPNPSPPLGSQFVNADTGITLDEAIARALAQEPTLRATRTEVEAVKGEQVQAGLRPNPTVSFMQQLEPAGTDSQTRIEMQWPLDLYRKSGRVAVADQAVRAAELSILDRERLLAADVRMKYGQVVAAIWDLTVTDALVAAMTRQVEIVRARVDRGSAAPLERNMVEVELRRLEADQFVQAGRAEQLAIEFKRLLGMSANDPLQLRDTLEQLAMREAAQQLRPAGPAAANRSDVQEAEARIRVADAQIDRAQRDGRVDMSLIGGYMRMDAGFPQLGLDAQGQPTPIRGLFHYVSVGVAVSLPLRSQNTGAVASAQAERAGAAARLRAAQLNAEAEIASAAARDQRAASAMSVYTGGARDLARQNLDVVTQTYQLGRATAFDVLAEQRRYLDFERSYSNTLREAYEARAALRRALGDPR